MKKVFSLFMSLIMTLSILTSIPLMKVTADAVDFMEIVSVETDGFENGEITYTLALKPGVKVSGAILQVEFDPEVLEPVMEWSETDESYRIRDDGAYITFDEYGDEVYSISGLYASGMLFDRTDAFSISFTSIEEYSNGSAEKPFMTFTFKAISEERPATNVKFAFMEFSSSDPDSQYISPEKIPLVFYTKTLSTLDRIKNINVASADNGIKIEWDAVDYASGYRIYREDALGARKIIANVDSNTTTYVDESVEPFEIYTYSVKPFDGADNVAFKCENSGSAFYNAAHDCVAGDWIIDEDATCTEIGYQHKSCIYCRVELETGEIPAKRHTETVDEAVAPTCTETGLTEGSHCSVCDTVITAQRIVAKKGHTASKWIVSKKATVNAAGSKYQKCTVCGVKIKTATIPQLKCSAPKLKKVANVATGVKFTWNKVTGADKYEVYRKTGKGAWKRIATVKGTVTSYTDKTAKSGTTYKYTVKAKNEAGLSKYNTTGLTIKCLADPTLKTPASTKSGITLKWNKITGAQGYVIYRKAGNGKFTKLTTVKGVSKVTYTDKKAKKGTKYTYKLKAYSGKTYSEYSNTKTIKDKY